MKALSLLIAALCLAALPAWGLDPAAQAAEAAARSLRASIEGLRTAEGGRARVRALTETIRAYESGLSQLRDALRRVALREAELRGALDSRQTEIAQFLGTLTVMRRDAAPLFLLHPEGPLGAARSAILLSSATASLQEQAGALAGQLREIEALQAVQRDAAAVIGEGLAAAQRARAELSKAMQNRTGLPKRFLERPEELDQLLAGVRSLDDFAQGLAGMENDIGPPMEDFEAAKGRLPLPVLGRVRRRAGEADAAGIARPGLVIATEPGALVTAPWPATLRYLGPLLDYGNVIVLEPAAGYLLVLAGLDRLYGEVGDVVDRGAPLGLMGPAEDGDAAAPGAETAGAEPVKTLYMELRQGKDPIDPGPWFAQTGDD
ncbi:murein hydrolase activator EnvC family protein [Albidovulum sp.]